MVADVFSGLFVVFILNLYDYEKMCFLWRSYSRIWIYQLIKMFKMFVALKQQWAYGAWILTKLLKNYWLTRPILQHFVGSKELLNWVF